MLLKSNVIGEGSQTLIILHGFLGMSDNWKSYAKNILPKDSRLNPSMNINKLKKILK